MRFTGPCELLEPHAAANAAQARAIALVGSASSTASAAVAAGKERAQRKRISLAADAAANWENQCAKCHGPDGKGDTKMGKKLAIADLTDAKVQAKFTDADAVKAMKEGIKDKDGKVIDIVLDSAYIQWQKNRIEARKWNAAKQRPKKYGDRITHSGDDNAPVVVENNHNVFGELLKAIKMERQEKAYGDKG